MVRGGYWNDPPGVRINSVFERGGGRHPYSITRRAGIVSKEKEDREVKRRKKERDSLAERGGEAVRLAHPPVVVCVTGLKKYGKKKRRRGFFGNP